MRFVAAERSDAGRFIVRADQELLPFSNSSPQLKPSDVMMNRIARNRMKNWEAIVCAVEYASPVESTSDSSAR